MTTPSEPPEIRYRLSYVLPWWFGGFFLLFMVPIGLALLSMWTDSELQMWAAKASAIVLVVVLVGFLIGPAGITITDDGIVMWSLAGKWHVPAHELEVVSASWPRVVIRADGSSFALGWSGLPGRDFADFVLALRSVRPRTEGW